MGETSPAETNPTRRSTRARVRAWLLALIGLLYLASVPWYRGTGDPVEIVFGLPDWVAVALGCYAAVAVLNAIAWILTEVPEEHPGAGNEEGP